MTALDGFLFLAAHTSRSQAYAQALRRHDLAPGRVLMFGKDREDKPCPVNRDGDVMAGLYLPDLAETLAETCERAGWPVEHVARDDVNHPDLAGRVSAVRPKFVIYSGYGGQLVGAELLGLDIPFIHMHSGWLPGYGGSTTLYYSWLRENSCSVTAFFLDLGINNGLIIARRRYPPPPRGIDVDHLYDGAIRADLLANILGKFARDGEFPSVPRDGEARTYYVIHPVLKHLAMFSREAAA